MFVKRALFFLLCMSLLNCSDGREKSPLATEEGPSFTPSSVRRVEPLRDPSPETPPQGFSPIPSIETDPRDKKPAEEKDRLPEKPIVEEPLSLEKILGRWLPFHEAGRDILCNHSLGVRTAKEIVETVVSRETGKQATHSKFDVSDRYGGNRHYEALTIFFAEENPDTLELTSYYTNDEYRYSYIEIKNRRKDSDVRDQDFTQVWYDPDCKLTGSIRTWEYNARSLLYKRRWFNTNFQLQRIAYANRDVQPLEAIYTNRSGGAKGVGEALSVANRTDRVLVAVIDSGVDYNHPGLAYKIPRPENEPIGWDFQDEDDQPYDYDDYLLNIWEDFHHGTQVAGIVAKDTDDIAILPIRYPRGRKEKWKEAVQFAHDRGARIVNLSLASDYRSSWEVLERSIVDHPDMLFVVAAGNEKRDLEAEPIFPAAFDYPNMIKVTSVDAGGVLSKFSNYSRRLIDVAAFGEKILSLFPEGKTQKGSGTSMATPQVTRRAALMKFDNPSLTPQDIATSICKMAERREDLRTKLRCGGFIR